MANLQQKIIETLGVEEEISPQAELQLRVDFLVDYALSIPSNRGFVLGISGGQDSTLAGVIAQLAAQKLRSQGRESEFVAVRLPHGVQQDEDDAQLALSFINPDSVLAVNIADGVDAISESVSEGMGYPVKDFHRGNIKARMRMIAQYAIAGERNLLVIGTDHAAEAVTGFFTKFGDGAADVLPLSGLTKGQGAEILKFLGAPAKLYEKAPTADLLDGTPGLTDEAALGLSYGSIDSWLRGEKIEPNEQELLEDRYLSTEHKRHAPVTPFDSWWRD